MVNSSSTFQVNTTQASQPVTLSKTSEVIRWSFVALIIVGFCFFILFIAIMLHIFCITPLLRENARYLLFFYMLVNDTFHLLITFFLLLVVLLLFYLPVPICFLWHTIGSMLFEVTPYNLAVMALERFVAICYPLHHAGLCTTNRANVAYSLTWMLLIVIHGAELVLMFSSATNLYTYAICKYNTLLENPIQIIIRTFSFTLCFGSVGIVIIFTYVKIMLVAHKVKSQSSTASKAGRTVMLHAFQLLLCMSSLLSTLVETLFPKKIDYLPITNFFFFSCVPRFLTPIIYGIRDEELRRHIKKSLTKYFH